MRQFKSPIWMLLMTIFAMFTLNCTLAANTTGTTASPRWTPFPTKESMAKDDLEFAKLSLIDKWPALGCDSNPVNFASTYDHDALSNAYEKHVEALKKMNDTIINHPTVYKECRVNYDSLLAENTTNTDRLRPMVHNLVTRMNLTQDFLLHRLNRDPGLNNKIYFAWSTEIQPRRKKILNESLEHLTLLAAHSNRTLSRIEEQHTQFRDVVTGCSVERSAAIDEQSRWYFRGAQVDIPDIISNKLQTEIVNSISALRSALDLQAASICNLMQHAHKVTEGYTTEGFRYFHHIVSTTL